MSLSRLRIVILKMSNPYESPANDLKSSSTELSTAGWWNIKRRVATILFVTPLFLALPVRYWVFNHAGSWLVSTDLEPDHRAVFLGLGYLHMMFSILVFATFPALCLLWHDRVKPWITGTLAVLFGLLLIPAAFLTWILVSCYLQYG